MIYYIIGGFIIFCIGFFFGSLLSAGDSPEQYDLGPEVFEPFSHDDMNLN